ncbi:MAG: hypothetical protein LF888_00275 [Candidatus Megaira endosymbiont of Mesostigma viride]|nr:MAG: hypothetical protein LF888_00275 [Candidatus Megaira endosymbiont of Mesostigma viride]HJK88208.1 hypothetical protein [Candidatus Megaira endosymbiont of Mesostigma viride]
MPPIILILGTSTSGKSTICTNPAFANFYQSGTDLVYKNFDILLDIVSKFVANLTALSSISNFKKVITEYKIDKTTAMELLTKNIMASDDSSVLIQNFYKDLDEHPGLYTKIFHSTMFLDAIHKALQNKPVILDVIPVPEADVSALFKETLSQYNLEGTIVAVHIGIDELAKRITLRNESENPVDHRIGMFPFMQYTIMFNKQCSDEMPTLSIISSDEINDAMVPLQRKYNVYVAAVAVPYPDNQVKLLKLKLGFTDKQIKTSEKICISPKSTLKYDILIDNTQDHNSNIVTIFNFALRHTLDHIIECFKTEDSLWGRYLYSALNESKEMLATENVELEKILGANPYYQSEGPIVVSLLLPYIWDFDTTGLVSSNDNPCLASRSMYNLIGESTQLLESDD